MPETKNYISKFQVPSGTVYDIKDAEARELISALGSPLEFQGSTTTALSDGATTNPIVINGENYTAVRGDVATYKPSGVDHEFEFVFNGTHWQEFGSTGSLRALAFKDSASGTVTPTGSVMVSTATTVNRASTVGTEEIDATHEKTYTPSGTIGGITVSLSSAGSTSTIKNPTAKTVATAVQAVAPGGTAPSNAVTYYSVQNETLSLYQLGYTTDDSIQTTNVTVKTGDASYSASTPTFTGEDVRLVTDDINVPDTFSASFYGNADSVTVS